MPTNENAVRLPPLTSAHSCRICSRYLEGDWSYAKTAEERAELDRLMRQGACDPCLERYWSEQVTERLERARQGYPLTPRVLGRTRTWDLVAVAQVRPVQCERCGSRTSTMTTRVDQEQLRAVEGWGWQCSDCGGLSTLTRGAIVRRYRTWEATPADA